MIFALLLLIAFNLYSIFLLPQIDWFDLFYFDLLVIVVWLACVLSARFRRRRREQEIKKRLGDKGLAAPAFFPFVNEELYRHDVGILEAERKQALSDNDELKDMVDRIVHELKANINTISLCNETLQNEVIQLAAETMNRQLSQLLLLAKLETNTMSLHYEKADVRDLLCRSIKNNKYFLIHERFSIQLDCATAIVYTDADWLVYVFDQLLVNAIKYKRDPKIEIAVRQNESVTTIEMTDYGIGIPAFDLPSVFEKGAVGSHVHAGAYKSTGMGLYFAKKALDHLSGTIEVQSESGQSTTFTIRLYNNEKIDLLRS
ncbi:sensor histidine kinase KdpD [uncultured Dubosiella sp.]|uniref:sensor histidine kinase n=1 Tax=uncultured Dubosiella sp. TaxID=1937011 RepID=UPI002730AC6C|nr:sensor histidine kinase [uncultured Dubosiella sp.]